VAVLALPIGWFCIRRTAIYFSMLSLAFAQLHVGGQRLSTEPVDQVGETVAVAIHVVGIQPVRDVAGDAAERTRSGVDAVQDERAGADRVLADVVVGAPSYDNGQTDEGRAFVYYGNGGPGLSVLPRQRRADDAAPIAQLGSSDSEADFRLSAIGRTPLGRGAASLQWEVKALGTLMNGAGLQQSAAYVDTTVSGISLSDLVTALTPSTPYHWRVRVRYATPRSPFQQWAPGSAPTATAGTRPTCGPPHHVGMG
jgi:hypothetical protein